MKKYLVSGWNNYGKMDNTTVMAEDMAEAERMAEAIGVFGTVQEIEG